MLIFGAKRERGLMFVLVRRPWNVLVVVTLLAVIGSFSAFPASAQHSCPTRLAMAVISPQQQQDNFVIEKMEGLISRSSPGKRRLELNYVPGTMILVTIEGTGQNEVFTGEKSHIQDFSTKIVARCLVKEVYEDGDVLMEITTLEYSGQVKPAEMGLPPLNKTIRKLQDKRGNIRIVEGAPGPGNYAKSDLVFPEEPVGVGDSWNTMLQLDIAGLPIDLDIMYTYTGEEQYKARRCLKLDIDQKAWFKNQFLNIRVRDNGVVYLDGDTNSPIEVRSESHSYLENIQSGMKVKGISRTVTLYEITIPEVPGDTNR